MQPLQVTEIIFMIPASAWVAHVAITRRDWLSAGPDQPALDASFLESGPIDDQI